VGIGKVYMITNCAASKDSNDSDRGAFRDRENSSIADAWQYGLNEHYWRHGITINQGMGWSVSEAEAKRRLNYIRVHLLKAIFGNNFRRKKAKITFLAFKQSAYKTDNQHFHALMAIEGDHSWSDQKIANAINEIECNREKKRWEKNVYVDWNWNKGNRFHGYVAREAALDADSVLLM
jgi:hypothetical protein